MHETDLQDGASVQNQASLDEQRLASYTAAADVIRADSQNKSRLTSATTLSRLPGIDSDTKVVYRVMAEIAGCGDVKFAVAADGRSYFYSELGLSRKEAEKLALGEEVRSQIADQVRQDSGKRAKLTLVDKLGVLIPGAEPDRIDGHLELLLSDHRYEDLKLISNTRGVQYLYSDEYMTATYALVLARAEANDPIGTIVETVREESRLYPRPTRLEMFSAPVFNMNPSEIERYAREIVKDPTYSDIKLAEASNGAFYLYSELYVSAKWVHTTIEWEEVEQFKNP